MDMSMNDILQEALERIEFGAQPSKAFSVDLSPAMCRALLAHLEVLNEAEKVEVDCHPV